MGLKRPIDTNDIYKNLSEHNSAQLTSQFAKLWADEKMKKHPRIYNVIVKIYAKKLVILSLLFAAVDIASR